jgi:peptidoglycan/LPS O-acetylase OafA/YrhL
MTTIPIRDGRSSNYLPTLDGWRALSVIAVMLNHDSIHSFGSLSDRWLNEHGHIGVDVFFAISGILICSRLLDEERERGRISLTGFYIRRVTRIMPPAIFYLCVIAILAGLSLIRVDLGSWLGSLLFYRNYTFLLGNGSSEISWYTGHFWSLSVEEHFYIFLPSLLVLTKKRYRILTLLVFIVLVMLRCGMELHTRPWTLVQFHTDVRLNSLLIPALFAVMVAKPGMREKFRVILRFWPLAAVGVILILTYWRESFGQVYGIAIFMPCIVLGSVLNPTGIIARFLELGLLRYIGRISYSLYLWQQLFFISHFAPNARGLGILQEWPLSIIMTFFCAIMSYHLLERPTSRFGHRLARTLERRPMSKEIIN